MLVVLICVIVIWSEKMWVEKNKQKINQGKIIAQALWLDIHHSITFVLDGDLLSLLNLEIIGTWGKAQELSLAKATK